jgi:hypothetical protein
MTGKDLIDAYKGDPAELAEDDAEIAAAQQKKQADTMTAADHAVKLQMALGKTKLAELSDDGQSVAIYALDGSGAIGVETVPFASFFLLDPAPVPAPADSSSS